MLNSSSKEIQFTAEQKLQTMEWHNRLVNIQEEIEKAKKQLNEVESAIEVKTKHNNYLEEMGSNIEKTIESFKTERDRLTQEVNSSTEKLSNHSQETSKRENALHLREVAVLKDEAGIDVSKKQLEERIKEHSIKVDKLSEHQLLVEKAREAFLKAAESVVWK